MSSIAYQLILHPVVSQSLKVGGTNLGRDKMYRAIQYLARFLAWVLLNRGYKIQAARWTALKAHLALARKVMRLGKPIEHLQAALRAYQTSGIAAEQITIIGRQLAYFGYLSYDAFVWANAVKFFNLAPSTADRVSRISNRFWLSGILLSITHNLLKAGRLANEVKLLQGQSWTDKGLAVDREARLLSLDSQRAGVRYQFVMDVLDVWIPASGLGLVSFNDGVLGIFGQVANSI
ncbi:hypothetical protein EUX98_g2179 [Antrodiella citrinella]|uniref:Peroxisomal biogenesis factor 11 n=1 Tax=Antrodiella citrinella TaxID=2447956 RepID=A0A4V3XJ80_9APHY|nr:hypothetical protein EUX98_g2179 [Antrodiella citrinella]